ncbi:MAG: hypothetical protein ACPG3W_08670 [Synechococcus sp.]
MNEQLLHLALLEVSHHHHLVHTFGDQGVNNGLKNTGEVCDDALELFRGLRIGLETSGTLSDDPPGGCDGAEHRRRCPDHSNFGCAPVVIGQIEGHSRSNCSCPCTGRSINDLVFEESGEPIS